MRSCTVIILSLLITLSASGQNDTASSARDTSQGRVYLLQEVERNGELLPEVEIKEVTIVGNKNAPRKVIIRKYDRMIFNLKKVYPYAMIVRDKFEEVNMKLAAMPDEKERKQYLKNVEREVLGEYEDDIRDMTITQGKLLIKLIDRETMNTSFDLIKQYRGGFSASFWQGIARIFGTNLKAEYDPWGEDAWMEVIILQIEAGLL